VLVEYSTWRWIFLINIPVAIAALVLVPRLVDRSLPSRATGLDVRGALLVTAGLAGIVFGLIEAASHDWTSARVALPLLAGLVLLPLFALSQRTAADPLLPLSFLRDRTRLSTDAVALLFATVFFAQFFVTTLYLQQVLGFGPLRTGLGFLPFGIAVGIALSVATKLVPRVGPAPAAGQRPADRRRRSAGLHAHHAGRVVPDAGAAGERAARARQRAGAPRTRQRRRSTGSPRTTPDWRRGCCSRCSRSAAPSGWPC
jgi:predicted MFS family arabinose efflux permease